MDTIGLFLYNLISAIRGIFEEDRILKTKTSNEGPRRNRT